MPSRRWQSDETLDASAEIWTTLNILAEIADLVRPRQRRHGTTAAASVRPLPLSRATASTSIGSTEQLIAAIAAAAQGNAQAREEVEAALPRVGGEMAGRLP